MTDGLSVIVAGSRDVRDAFGDRATDLVALAIESTPFEVAEVVSGGADGVDAIGEEYAAKRDIDIKRFEADWDTLGDMAGPKRNSEMAAYADAAVIVRVDGSSGSSDMLRKAERHLGEERTFVIDVDTAAGE